MRRLYYLIRRNEYWYYRLNRESGLVESDDVTWHTTGCKNRRDAERFLEDLLAGGRYQATPARYQSFYQYSAPFFIKFIRAGSQNNFKIFLKLRALTSPDDTDVA